MTHWAVVVLPLAIGTAHAQSANAWMYAQPQSAPPSQYADPNPPRPVQVPPQALTGRVAPPSVSSNQQIIFDADMRPFEKMSLMAGQMHACGLRSKHWEGAINLYVLGVAIKVLDRIWSNKNESQKRFNDFMGTLERQEPTSSTINPAICQVFLTEDGSSDFATLDIIGKQYGKLEDRFNAMGRSGQSGQ